MRDEISRLGGELGFALVAVTGAARSPHGGFYLDWLAAGHQGEMAYLERNAAVRLDPGRLLPGARSIVCVADFYPSEPTPRDALAADQRAARGRVARYAWGDDYHKVLKKRLHALADALRQRYPHAEYKCTTDTAPLMEREHAARAGLGFVGKHTLLIHPTYGSYMLLGCVVTTLEAEPAVGADAQRAAGVEAGADHCGSCRRCIDACPTQCIEDPDVTGRRALHASRCISYLTLEHRSLIPLELHEAMGDWIAGCDVCQEVCPYNRIQPLRFGAAEGDRRTGRSEAGPAMHWRYAPRGLAHGLGLLEVLRWRAEDRARVFQGSALKRMKLEMVQRNALIAAGNYLRVHDEPELRAAVQQLAADAAQHALVRETAQQVLARLSA